MQQCMKSDISSTQGNSAAVPALRGHGHSGLPGGCGSVRGVVVVMPRGLQRWV